MATPAVTAQYPTNFPQQAQLPVGVRVFAWAAGAGGDTGAALDISSADMITITAEGTVTDVDIEVSNDIAASANSWQIAPNAATGADVTFTATDAARIAGRWLWMRPKYVTATDAIIRAVLIQNK